MLLSENKLVSTSHFASLPFSILKKSCSRFTGKVDFYVKTLFSLPNTPSLLDPVPVTIRKQKFPAEKYQGAGVSGFQSGVSPGI